MAQDINLNSKAWRDLIFEGKNKKYGAYYLRETSDKRHIRALLILLGLVAMVILLPLLIESVKLEETEIEVEVGTTEISDLNLKKNDIPEEKIIEAPQAPPPPQLRAAIQFIPPKAVDKSEIKEDVEIATTEEVIQSSAVVGTQNVEGDLKKGEILDDLEKVVVAPPKEENKPEEIFQAAEQQPTFPGGEAELMRFLQSNLRYPPAAAEQGIEGRVAVQFVVSKTGAISGVKILQSLHPSCDKEAERLIKSMPKWIPGKQNGNPVNVYYTIPIRFKLEQR